MMKPCMLAKADLVLKWLLAESMLPVLTISKCIYYTYVYAIDIYIPACI